MNKIGFLGLDQRGNVAVMFGLSLFPALLVTGMAIDYSQASKAGGQLQVAADSAALAVGQQFLAGADPATFKAMADKIVGAVANDPYASVSSVAVETMGSDKKLCVTVISSVPTSFMKLVGTNQLTVNALSCATAGAGGLEIAMVLDTSESMLDSAGSMSKLDSLKTAATNFVNSLYGSSATNPNLKVSIVPFSSSVAVDPVLGATAAWADTQAQSPYHWTGFSGNIGGITTRWDIWNQLKAKRSDWYWKGCFESLPFPQNTQDTTPTASDPKTLLIPMIHPDEPDSSSETFKADYLVDKGPNCPSGSVTEAVAQSRICKYKNPTIQSSLISSPLYGCRSQPVLQMTTTKATLLSKITGLIADGTTNIHEGVMWGWRTISPNGPFRNGSAYGASSKVIVLMTDGMNTWYDVANTLNASRYGAHGYYNTKDASGRNDRTPTTKIDGTSLPKPTNDAGGRAVLDDLTRRTCKNARDAGVTIYAIAFSTAGDPIDTEGHQLLKDCAGDVSRFYTAATSIDINTVFGKIANSVGKGRLRLVD